MRTPLVAGNWKLNGTKDSINSLLAGLKEGRSADQQAVMAVCPSHCYLGMVADLLQGSGIVLGSQDVSDQVEAGAYTGEVAGFMLKDIGCQYGIVGHSERRSIFGESNEKVAEKFVAAQKAGLTPIFCVGETLEQRESGSTEDIVAKQIDAVINLGGGVNAFENAVIAYEPVWAIGTGKTATPDQAQEVHAFIRQRIASQNPTVAEKLQILYGGSVKADNADSLFTMEDIDGGLIGGASLKVDDFLAIYKAAG